MKTRLFLLIGIVLVCTTVLMNPPDRSLAQSGSTISGIVRDADGPVVGAIVRVRATTQATVTNTDGQFTLSGLTPDQPVKITAWAAGYYITGTDPIPPGTSDAVLTLVAHTNTDNPDYEWLSAFASEGEAGNCENCHSSANYAAVPFTLPFDEWSQDAHANTASNPRFLTMYRGTDINGNQSPPTRFGYSRDYGAFPLRPDMTQPYYGPGYKLDFPATAGNCAACHTPAAAINQPYSIDPTTVAGVGAEGVACDYCHKVWDVRLNPASGLPYTNMPGVLSFTFRRPPEEHQFFAGPYDDVGFEGSEDTFAPVQTESAFCAPCHFGAFWDTTVYNSFGEWLASPYSDSENGQTCQDCHMPPRGATRFAQHEQAMERDPATIFSHLMPGAADIDLLQNTAELHATAERTADQITVTVEVTNTFAGHHIPTDSPLRQILLVVTATDESGEVLPLVEGPSLPDWTGDLAGQPGAYYARLLQELWTEVVPTGAYWNPTRIAEDTRLAALASDTSAYTFALPADGSGPITVEVRLLFRRAFYDLMQQKGWDVPDILMEQTTITLNIE